MTKFRSIATVAALLFATSAFAADGGWNTKYGMLFGVQNVFGNNNASVLSGFQGQVGLQYTLAPQRAVRISLNLSRVSNPAIESETTNNITGTTDKSVLYPDMAGYDAAAGYNADPYTSMYGVNLGATYMMRLTTTSIAPYLGVGGALGYSRDALKYTDDVNSDLATTERNNTTSRYALGALGVLGVEWRVHPSIALFAEYNLNLELVSYESVKTHTIVTSKTTGTTTTDTQTSGSGKRFLNWDTGIGQGGLLGMVAYF